MNLLDVKYVQLRGITNIAGRSTSNIDPARDGCVVHLHEETGGVFVTYGVSDQAQAGQAASSAHSHYIAGMGVESVDLTNPLVPVRYITPVPPSLAPQVAQAELDEVSAAEHRTRELMARMKGDAPAPAPEPTLADKVLAEFQDNDAKPHPRRKKK